MAESVLEAIAALLNHRRDLAFLWSAGALLIALISLAIERYKLPGGPSFR